MIDTNESTTTKINIQAQLDNIWEIGGPVALASVAEALNSILAQLGADTQRLSADDRAAAAMTGTALSVIAVQKAKAAHRDRVVASLPADDLAACRLGGWDPVEFAAQKQEAESELTALSFTARADLSKRCGGNLVTMALTARREGLL
jgi:hypothetical protein